jgi:hypothetical protein
MSFFSQYNYHLSEAQKHYRKLKTSNYEDEDALLITAINIGYAVKFLIRCICSIEGIPCNSKVDYMQLISELNTCSQNKDILDLKFLTDIARSTECWCSDYNDFGYIRSNASQCIYYIEGLVKISKAYNERYF